MKHSVVRVMMTVSLAPLAAGAGEFSLSSPSFDAATPLPVAQVFEGFGCHGGNRSPALRWTNAPAATKSFAITMFDPDAPTGSGWWHWVVYNLPPSITALPEDAGRPSGERLPSGSVHGRTDFGLYGYGGACPPEGAAAHRYVITLHALRVAKLDLPADASAALVGFLIHANRLASASIQTTFAR